MSISPHRRQADDRRIAAIDIGSNSVRLVVYDAQKRVPLPLYNEKVMCALGKGLAKTGEMNPQGMDQARQALARYITLSRRMGVESLHVIATAAVRGASNGDAFVRELEARHQLPIIVVSGEKEAELAAHGVLATIHRPQGLVGDLGGGSLELARIGDTAIGPQVTLPIGTLALLDRTDGSRDALRKAIDGALAGLDWLKLPGNTIFYAIGGSFRALAKLHMVANNYPLKILHQYSVNGDELATMAKQICSLSRDEIAQLPGVSDKRATSMVAAVLVLERIIKTAQIERVIFSAAGIREGYLFEQLPPALQGEDALIAACLDLTAQTGHLPDYADELYAWMTPLFPQESEAEARLRRAACILSETAWRIHPEYRADWAFHRILHSALVALEHDERVMLSGALYYRYQYKSKPDNPAWKMLGDRQKGWAKVVGAAMHLAYHLTGGVAGTLPMSQLSIEEGKLALFLQDSLRDLAGDTVRKRLDGLGEVFKGYTAKMALS